MIRRYLQYENFRTIGIDGETLPENKKLIINETDLKVNRTFGGLVSLIGLNNTGKSNAIAGVKALVNGLTKDDEPDFIYDDKVKTNLYWVFQDKEKDFKYKFNLHENKYFLSWDVDTKNMSSRVLNDLEMKKISEINLDLLAMTYNFSDNKKVSRLITDLGSSVDVEFKYSKKSIVPVTNESQQVIVEKSKINILESTSETLKKEGYFDFSNKYTKYLSDLESKLLSNDVKFVRLSLNDLNQMSVYSRNIKLKVSSSLSVNAKKLMVFIEELERANATIKTPYVYLQKSLIQDANNALSILTQSVLRGNSNGRNLNTILQQHKNKAELYNVNDFEAYISRFDIVVVQRSIDEFISNVSKVDRFARKYEKGFDVANQDLYDVIKVLNDLAKTISVKYKPLKDLKKKILEFTKKNKTENLSEKKLAKYLKESKLSSDILHVPNVFDYNLSNGYKYSDLEIQAVTIPNVAKKIKSSDFFYKLFKLLEFDINTVEMAYKKSVVNRGSLKKLRRDVNKKLDDVSDKFNKLYFQDSSNWWTI